MKSKNKENYFLPLKDLTEKQIDEIMTTGCITLECGCVVEPDGVCPCGNKSPLINDLLI